MTKLRSVLRWSLVALLAACTDSNSPSEPALVVPTTPVTLSAIKPDSVVQTFQITSATPVQWTASSNVPWLTIRTTSGTTPATVTVIGKTDLLSPGKASAVISIRTPNTQNQPYSVPVELTVAAPRVLTLSSTSLAFSGVRGQASPAAQSVSITISDGATTPWTATTDAPWLSVTPTSGTGNGSISVRAATGGLAAGQFTGRVTVAAPVAGNSPQVISVALTVVEQRTITASPSPAGLGSVSGAGAYPSGQVATLIATPVAGAEFVNWTENGTPVATSTSYSFLVDRDRTLVANFRLRTFTITTTSNPAGGGRTSGGGQVSPGATVTVSATATPGFIFTRWTEADTTVATSTDYTFVATASRSLVATFDVDPAATVNISATANPANGGTVTGAGNYQPGATVTLTATPASGFSFTNWTENGAVVATTATLTFAAASNRVLVANFGTAPTTATITTSSNPPGLGTTTGDGVYPRGTTPVTVTATATFGNQFVNWTEGTNVVSLSRVYTFVPTADRNLVANFSAGPGINILTASVSAADELTVRARVTTDFTLTSVQLSVSGRSVAMTQATADEWTGTLSLTGLPAGDLDAVVTATDNRGISSSATRRFTHTPPAASQRPRRP